jgi:alpha 1,3-glucosidase
MFGYGNDKMDDTTAVTGTQTHWFSESGVLDIFVFFGPTPKDIVRQYVSLTGAPMMPPLFSIGYHQCRYNYGDEKEILDIDNSFDKNEIPYDVIWLDVDYTDGYKYFTWNKTSFPDPLRLQKQLEDKGRKVSTEGDSLSFFTDPPPFSLFRSLSSSIHISNAVMLIDSIVKQNGPTTL